MNSSKSSWIQLTPSKSYHWMSMTSILDVPFQDHDLLLESAPGESGGSNIVENLLQAFLLPKEAQQIDRILRVFVFWLHEMEMELKELLK